MRWVRWLLSHITRLHDVIVVNMDETRLDNQTQWQHGYHVQRKCQIRVAPEFVSGPVRERRRTLLAALCSDASLQRHLPQVILHKDNGKGAATQPGLLPEQAASTEWSNNTGSIDIKTLRRWVYTLRCAVDKQAPSMWIILVLDCCPVHLSKTFLQYCCRLGVVLVILPARCTWFIQPLDVYVFGALKRKLANALAARRCAGSISTSADTVPWPRQQQAEATSFLTRADCARAVARCGLHLDCQMWRLPLRNLVLGCDLKARLPSVDELAVLLGRSPTQAAKMLPLLLSWPQRLQGANVPTHPPRTFLPLSRPRAPGKAREHSQPTPAAAADSSARTIALPHATRLFPAARFVAPAPAPALSLGPAHGTRKQAAARKREHGL